MSCYSRWSSRSIKSVNLGSPNSSFFFYRLLTATTQLSRTRLAFLVTKGWLLKKKFHLPLNRFRGVARFLTTSACQRQKQALWEDDWSRPRGQHGPNITAIHPNIFRDYKKKVQLTVALLCHQGLVKQAAVTACSRWILPPGPCTTLFQIYLAIRHTVVKFREGLKVSKLETHPALVKNTITGICVVMSERQMNGQTEDDL